MENSGIPSRRSSLSAPALVGGFAAAIALWVAWFLTHLPWLQLPEQVAKLTCLVVWLVATIAATRLARIDRHAAIPAGILIGLVSALLGLLILGSKLTAPAAPAGTDGKAGSLIPSAGLIALGFVGLGTAIGLVSGLLAPILGKARGENEHSSDWLARFGWVAVATAAPLLVIGGLVTSTQSGMAVPDWPNTYGSNMFLYPLSASTDTGVFVEHTHRLFGSLLGLTVLTLMIWTIRREPRGWVKAWAGALFVLVCVQGVLGGYRVIENERVAAIVHGVLGQIVFAGLTALAVFLSPAYRSTTTLAPPGNARRLKVFAAVAMHSALLQLVFGAMYRHLRSPHALWSHAAFSLVVVAGAAMAGMLASTLPNDRPLTRILRRVGRGLVVVVVLQFLLGWVTFILGGKLLEAQSIPQALLRTSHQANGALLIAFATATAMYSRHLWKSSTPATT